MIDQNNILYCGKCSLFKEKYIWAVNETEKQKKYMLRAYKERDYWKEQKHAKDRELKIIKQKLNKAIKAFEEMSRNPYPQNIFIPINEEDFEKIDNLCKQHLGYSIDRLSGDYGRFFSEMYRKKAQKTLKEIGGE